MIQAGVPGELAFRYDAVGQDGRTVRDLVHASDEASALRRLAADGLVVTRLRAVGALNIRRTRRELRFGERVLVLRQLALMVNAGVPLLEALETVRDGLDADVGRDQFAAVIAALMQGDSFGHALATHTSGFPAYVHALASVGEASGRIGEVLADAAGQMDFEHRLQRELINALTYPLFLMCAGVGAIGFILINIVPRFSAMIGDHIDKAPAASRLLLQVGDYLSAHTTMAGLIAAGVVLAAVTAWRDRGFRQRLYRLGRRAPLVGGLLKAREIALWSRLAAFALAHGVEILNAAALARQAMPDGQLRTGLLAFESDLKAGRPVDIALARNTTLSAMDLSLLRAGQRSGALAPMFAALADKYEGELRDGLKRLMSLIEPTAIGLIALVVGAVALSLVLALTSIYDTVY
ncbi:MAG TPA: type II secretion system F family protein [Caulobacteraceae bacterium]